MLAKRKHPSDLAPDWIDQTYGQRLFNALMALKLFGFLTEEEAITVADRISEWVEGEIDKKREGKEVEI